jgi:SAM-dependent methyltransferase
MVAIAGFTKEQILAAVQQMYTEVARMPSKEFHFPTGRAACLFVGYPAELLDSVPSTAVESFAGVGFPFGIDVIRPGDRVLDIGAGAGTDTLVAARLVGNAGKVIALDMTPAMLDKLRHNIARADMSNVEILEGNAEAIPLPDASVDVITSNGVLNLVPDKPKAFSELFRVLRPGGRVQIADIVVGRPVSESARANPKLWAECVVGASLESDYLELFASCGFTGIRVLRRFDYFSGSASTDTKRVAASLGAQSIEITMTKPASNGRSQ